MYGMESLPNSIKYFIASQNIGGKNGKVIQLFKCRVVFNLQLPLPLFLKHQGNYLKISEIIIFERKSNLWHKNVRIVFIYIIMK